MKLQKLENKIIIVTGLSGAGRTTALKILEDIGFEAVDNLPFFLLHTIVESKVKKYLIGEPLEVSIFLNTPLNIKQSL